MWPSDTLITGESRLRFEADLECHSTRDLTMLAVSELQPLWGQFRNLPYQAIGARLADVKPAQGDWKPEDTVWFNGRVADKQFVSVVKAVEGTAEEPLVVLSLVDTSHPSEDRFISQELIQVHVDNS